MTRLLWLGRSPAWRAAAVVAAIVIAGAGWYLGSPLFIRTTLNEELPTFMPAATQPATALPSGRVGVAPVPEPQVAILAKGELQFVDNLHNGKGPVTLVRVGEQRVLRFQDVSITNAPDVHVYLSRETGGKWSEATSLYLGPLKATNGSFNYDIPANADLSLYKSVVVWCRVFTVLITWADLKPG
ncbi:MAG: DM13 domain-containing protein [Chloroflexi bacterium]|nr:DM13 domain-containing protein [Chloroflexota bacterium]